MPETPLNLERFEHHYGYKDPDLADHMWEVVAHLQARCPVVHSDAPVELGVRPNGMWVITGYAEALSVLQDWETFSSAYPWQAAAGVSTFGDMPPITTDPPLQRHFRRLLNPFLSPEAVAPHEPAVRRIVTELIDDFIEDGHCDLVRQVAHLHPPRMLYRVLFGVEDEAELQRTLGFMDALVTATDVAGYASTIAAWTAWIAEFVESRRAGPRRPDLIDALLHGTVDGRPLRDDEIFGAIRILILGGFFTTTDATTSTMMLLLEHPEVLAHVRREPGLLPKLFEETLRLEAPVISQHRVCTRQVELRGQKLREGDAVLVHFGGANRDPEAFDEPAELRMERTRNRHLAFGGGPHYCIGSNVAKLNLRVVFEELLGRLHDIRITEGDAPRRGNPGLGRGWAYVPLSFTPGRRGRVNASR